MKNYFKNLKRDIKSTWDSWKVIQYDIETLYLQWRVLRMLSIKYPNGEFDKPLDEVSAKRYDKQMKRIEKKIANDEFHSIDY